MKIEFHGDPELRPIGRSSQWAVTAAWAVSLWRVDGGPRESLVVPAGFLTDLASVPRVPGAYLLFGGRARRSAILHDYLYKTQAGKAFADRVFLAAMKAEGVNWVTRQVMFVGVRWFGGTAYADKRR